MKAYSSVRRALHEIFSRSTHLESRKSYQRPCVAIRQTWRSVSATLRSPDGHAKGHDTHMAALLGMAGEAVFVVDAGQPSQSALSLWDSLSSIMSSGR